MEKYSGNDILVSISHFLPQKRFYHNYDALAKFFDRRQDKYSVLRESCLIGNERAIKEELWNSYFCLTAADLLISWGLDFNPHEFTDKCEVSYRLHKKPMFSKPQLSELEKIAKDFKKEFCKPEQVR